MVRGLGLLVRAGLLGWALALAAGCVDDAEARRGRWRAEVRPPTAASPDAGVADSGAADSGPVDSGTDIFERHDFDVCYSAHQISGASWPSAPADAARALTAVGSNATTGVSTAGLTDTGIGAARVDQAATVADGNNGYSVASGWIVLDADWIWSRVLVRRDAAATSGDYLWRYINGTSFFGHRFTGAATTRVNEVAGAGFTQFNAAYTSTEDAWELLDTIHCSTCGAGSLANRTLYRNGSLSASTDHTDDTELVNLTGAFNMLGGAAGINSPQYVTFVAACFKFGAGNMITLEQHEIDAADIGL